VNYNNETPTKEKILMCAAEMFADKGYTEASVRELADAVGLKGASIYHHFPSKNAILEHLLEDYKTQTVAVYRNTDIRSILKENPTSEGILSCMQTTFPKERQEYFFKTLFVLLQEQHRNPLIQSFMAELFIPRVEWKVQMIIEVLKELNVIRQDTDPDFWMKTCSSLMYTFAHRVMLGIGDSSPGFSGMGMVDLIKCMFDMMLERCAV